MSLRSYHGCVRCKKRRQKCNEGKPSCIRCLSSNAKCEYSIVLKWNGRVPRDSLGRKRDSEASRLKSNKEVMETIQLTNKKTANNEVVQSSPQLEFLRPIELTTSASRFLLHHFATKASMIASHSRIRDLICAQVIPVAHKTPSLLYATMALASINRTSLLDDDRPDFTMKAETVDLIAKSLHNLQEELLNLKGEAKLILIHTIRMLCTCEIFSGKADSAWRIHVEGAKAIMESLKQHLGRSIATTYESSDWLASRWFLSVEALTALTTLGLRKGQLEEGQPSIGPSTPHHYAIDGTGPNYYFDLYSGYSSDLNSVLKEIGAAAWERKRFEERKVSLDPINDSTLLSEADLQREATLLEQSIQFMMERDLTKGLRIPPQLYLNDDDLQQFTKCNQAYMLSALIHILRKVRNLQSDSFEVQYYVKEIIAIVSSILPVTELSAWVLLTTPIFTAGCEAIGSDRLTIKDLLRQLYDTLRIRNILRTMIILERRWENFDSYKNIKHLDGDTKFQSTAAFRATSVSDIEMLDFIPY